MNDGTNSTSTSMNSRRRILIISGDESIIREIQQNKYLSQCKSMLIEAFDEEVPSTNTVQNSNKRKKTTMICAICESPASGFNFDVISCESCKSFFRRNALRDPPLKCPNQGLCDMKWEFRRRCSACRLKRCIEAGMKTERILMAKVKSKTRRENQNPIPLLDEDLFLFSECFQETTTPSSKALLSREDLERLQSIQELYQRRIELAREGLPWNPSMHAITLLQKINSHSVPLMRLLIFFKQIPEFNQLNLEDKVTLIKFNLLPLLCINCTLSYDSEKDLMAETESDVPWDPAVLQSVYGVDGYQAIKRVFDRFLHIAKYDQKIIQLSLITFMLTKGFSPVVEKEPILIDAHAVFRAQNYYTELLWKYLEAVHGFDLAIEIISKLIMNFMSWQMLQIRLRNHIEQTLLSTDTNELLPFMKALLNMELNG